MILLGELSQELIIDGNNQKLDKKDSIFIQDVLHALFLKFPTLCYVDLRNIDMSNIYIPRLLKDSPTCNIYFPGKNEYVDKLKNQKINISHDTNTQLFVSKECHSKETISEYDFWIGLKNAQAAHSVPSINISDIGSILKYTSISEIKIKAKNQDDINKISEIFKKVSVPVAVNVKDFKYIKYIPNNLKVNIFTPDVASLNKETLEKLEAQHINIENVAIPMNYYNNNYYYEHELDSFQFYNYNPNKRDIFYGSDVYNIDTYKKIVEKLQEITNGITPKNSEFKKFMTIYYRLSSAICYNFFNDDECVSLYRADIHLIIILKVV